MTRIVIPLYDGVDMLDVCGPYEMFQWAGFEIDLLAATAGELAFNTEAVSANRFTFNVTGTFGTPAEADALWVPGGAPDRLSTIIADKHGPYLTFLGAQAQVSRYVCSVCEGALLLAAAGLLDGYTVTTHWAFVPYLIEHFPEVGVADGHPRFQLDRNRLTGGGISSGLDEALKLIELLAGESAAATAQQSTQYYPRPPVSSAIPNKFDRPM